MELKPGTRLGPYEIIAQIGEGGMGQVWKARDTRLGRDVALKVSRSEFTARFEREARSIAALSHPNICALYDVGPNYLVMEMIEGVPLKGPLPMAKAVEYAGQILDALDAAHRKGIIHRDLKPANVLVTKQGIKLLDFGLAKQAVSLKDDAPTVDPVSIEGQVSGTLQYMSPEQLQGKEADARSDIFAFGCVLYEMLSGRRAFAGSSAASVIAAILEREPEPLKATPPLDRVVRACLAKEADLRFQTAADLKRNLMWAAETNTAALPGKTRLPWIVTAAALLLAMAGLALYFPRADIVAPEIRVDIVTPPTASPGSFALSPDGSKIAYVANSEGASRLWVRRLDSIAAQVLPGTQNANNPFWSPDSRSLGFFADLKLKRIDSGDGQPQILADVSTNTANASWNEDGVILFNPGTNSPLLRVPAGGGGVIAAIKLGKGQYSQRSPRFLSGGRQFFFVATGFTAELWLGSLDGTEPRRITALAPGVDSAGEGLRPGWLLQVRQNVLSAQAFDTATGQLSGGPIGLAQAVGVDPLNWSGAFSLAAKPSGSPGGTIAWRNAAPSHRQLIWFDGSGRNTGAFGVPDPPNLLFPELSPDGKRALVTRGFGNADIWVQESRGVSRFTFDPADDRHSIWSPDGEQVVFNSNRKGRYDLYQKPANGAGNEEVLLQTEESKYPTSWSPDGRYILYRSTQNNGDLMVLPLTGDRQPYPFLSTPFNEQQGVFSPDGRWVAYESNESGTNEIYVRPFPGPGGQWKVSIEGGISPRWRKDGKELYYISPESKLMSAAVTTQGAKFVTGIPEALFQTHIVQIFLKAQYDVAPDGRFLINTELENTSTEPIHLLLNWKPPK